MLGACEFSKALNLNETLLALDLSHNPLGDDGLLKLASSIQVNSYHCWFIEHNLFQINKTLIHLNLVSVSATSKGLLPVLSAIESNVTLQSVYLSKNVLHGLSTHQSFINHEMECVGSLMQHSKSLNELALSQSCVSDHGVQTFSKGFSLNTSLHHLDLSGFVCFMLE